MLLELKHSLNNWIEVGTNSKGEVVKFLIDYPAEPQQRKLEGLLNQSLVYENQEFDQDGRKLKLRVPIDFDLVKHLEYKRLMIKYTIKDWQGVNEPIKIIDNELEDSLWWALVRDGKKAQMIYDLIKDEIEFSETDKKK